MSWLLQGPYPLDLRAVGTSAAAALEVAREWFTVARARAGLADQAGVSSRPGLYLLWNVDDQPALAGFWLAFGGEYLEAGPVGPPDREPPFVAELLVAATEAVWWDSFRVWPRRGGTWSPLVVLEWLPSLADRSELPPPGEEVPPALRERPEVEREDDDEPEGWLLPEDGPSGPEVVAPVALVEPTRPTTPDFLSVSDLPAVPPDAPWGAPRVLDPLEQTWPSAEPGQEAQDAPVQIEPEELAETVRADPPDEPFAASPDEPLDESPVGPRSLLAVVQGELVRGRTSHRGRFALLDPDHVVQRDRWRWTEWPGVSTGKLGEAAGPAEPPVIGPLVELPGPRYGHLMHGWLTQSLGPWPASRAELREGTLQARDIGARAVRQGSVAVMLTVAVVLAGLVLAVLVQELGRPPEQDAPPAPVMAAQPALSLCSVDHDQFLAELRCQVDHLARGGDPKQAVCRDAGSGVHEKLLDFQRRVLARENLLPGWCGLRDRAVPGDSFEGEAAAWSDLAAGRACFNVLGHPYTYAVDPDAAALRPRAQAMLEPGGGQVGPLTALVDELDAVCEAQRPRFERRLQGALLASTIGVKPPAEGGTWTEPQKLRSAIADTVLNELSGDDRRCFEAGMASGPGEATSFGSLCDDGERLTGGASALARRVLGGEPGAAVSPAPILDRYFASRFVDGEVSGNLWVCHEALDRGVPARTERPWLDVPVPRPDRYRATGLVRTQLQLDAALLGYGQGADLGPCWSVLAELLTRYEPVHPLLAPPEEGTWPSPEQRLCGQICAARYRLRSTPAAERWHTPDADVELCTDGSGPTVASAGMEALRLPWNGTASDGWQPASAPDICAFHVLAQGYLPLDDEPVLPADVEAFAWAGTLEGGIAGTDEGLAARSARNLGSYGRSRSRQSCGSVAAQCLTGGLLRVTGGASSERQGWNRAWSAWLGTVLQERPEKLASRMPWCGLVQPFLPRGGRLPEGQLDYPCTLGVEETRRGLEESLVLLRAGSPEGAP